MNKPYLSRALRDIPAYISACPPGEGLRGSCLSFVRTHAAISFSPAIAVEAQNANVLPLRTSEQRGVKLPSVIDSFPGHYALHAVFSSSSVYMIEGQEGCGLFPTTDTISPIPFYGLEILPLTQLSVCLRLSRQLLGRIVSPILLPLLLSPQLPLFPLRRSLCRFAESCPPIFIISLPLFFRLLSRMGVLTLFTVGLYAISIARCFIELTVRFFLLAFATALSVSHLSIVSSRFKLNKRLDPIRVARLLGCRDFGITEQGKITRTVKGFPRRLFGSEACVNDPPRPLLRLIGDRS